MMRTLWPYVVAVLLLALALALDAGWARGQQMACGERAVIVKTLTKYGETPRERAPNDAGTVVYEFWANAVSGSWTLLMSTPDGRSCVVALGRGWKAAGAGA